MNLLNSIYEVVVIGGIILLFTAPFIAYILSNYVFNGFYDQEFEKFKIALRRNNRRNK
jgi:hypothetical protein